MKVLVVGAGAVGQVYGRALQLAGSDVSFMVKEKYAEEARAGYAVYPLNRPKKKRLNPVRFEGFGVVTSTEEVNKEKWDAVLLSVSSTALRGAWLDELIPAMGDATLISLQPGLDDRSYILERLPEERLVQGLITAIAYQAPLPGESHPQPGVAYWFPPMAPAPLSGPTERVMPLIRMLKRGGLPCERHKDLAGQADFPTAIMMPHLVALEAAGWKFAELKRGDHLELACRATDEAMRIVARHRNVSRPLSRFIWRPFLISAILSLSKMAIPFDLEIYLEYHFTKVGDQTRLFMNRYIELGQEHGTSVSTLRQLCSRLPTPASTLNPPRPKKLLRQPAQTRVSAA